MILAAMLAGLATQAAMPGMTSPDTAPASPMAMPSASVAAPPDAQPVGDAPPPSPPTVPYADQTYGAAAMAAARAVLRQENGGVPFSQVLLNLAEGQAGGDGTAYRWDGEAWFGGDLNRAVAKSEGYGDGRAGLQDADAQALYSRAVTPYFNLQAGARESFGDSPSRTWGVVGFEGVAPYWIETEGALFVSTHGEVEGRLEGWYDLPVTQRLVLQPRAELNLAAEDAPRQHTGASLSDAELGLRLRYEVRPDFAPYIGVSWLREVGRTADYASAEGENPSAVAVVFGVRTWF